MGGAGESGSVGRSEMIEGTTVLVVDDEPHIRRAVRSALRDDIETVLEAATAEQALMETAARRPDLIILDLVLPDRSGQWVCREIRKWSTIPIIVLSAHHSEREKVELLNLGVDD